MEEKRHIAEAWVSDPRRMQDDVVRTWAQSLKLLFLDLLVFRNPIGRAAHVVLRMEGFEEQQWLEYFPIVAVERKRGDGHHSPVEIDTGMDS